jgi:hypothetical protein
MAGKNLFDQGRSGSRHSDDEDGIASLATLVCSRGKEIRREQRLRPGDMTMNLVRVMS